MEPEIQEPARHKPPIPEPFSESVPRRKPPCTPEAFITAIHVP